MIDITYPTFANSKSFAFKALEIASSRKNYEASLKSQAIGLVLSHEHDNMHDNKARAKIFKKFKNPSF